MSLLQKRPLPKQMKNTYLTDFIKVTSSKTSDSITPPSTGKSLVEQKGAPWNKKAKSSNYSAVKYELPKTLHNVYDLKGFKDNRLGIWHWNINGLNASLSKGKLQAFFDKAQPDILCLNETKVDHEKLYQSGFDSYIPRMYEQFWNFCKTRKGYSGTAIFSKVKPQNVTYGIGIDKHDQEGRVITAEFDLFVLVAVYVPNSGEGLRRIDYRINEWDADFYNYIHNLKLTSPKPVILAGDLNVAHDEIDIYDPYEHEKDAGFTIEERNSFTNFLKKGYIDTYRKSNPDVQKFTFWNNEGRMRSGNRGWRIDYMIVHEDDYEMVMESTIHNDYWGSDHCPVQLKIDLNRCKKYLKQRGYKKDNGELNDVKDIQEIQDEEEEKQQT